MRSAYQKSVASPYPGNKPLENRIGKRIPFKIKTKPI